MERRGFTGGVKAAVGVVSATKRSQFRNFDSAIGSVSSEFRSIDETGKFPSFRPFRSFRPIPSFRPFRSFRR